MLFNYDDRGCLTFVSKLDIPKQSIQRNMSAMERFRNMDKRATTEDRNTALETLHQNSITYVLPSSLQPPGASRSGALTVYGDVSGDQNAFLPLLISCWVPSVSCVYCVPRYSSLRNESRVCSFPTVGSFNC